MKITKRITSVLVTGIMLASTLPVNAALNAETKVFDCRKEYFPSNWEISYQSDVTEAEKENLYFVTNTDSADNITGSKGALYLMSNQTGNMAKNDSTVKKEIAIQGTLSETASKDKKYRLSIDVWQGGGLMTACYMRFGNISSDSFKEFQWATEYPENTEGKSSSDYSNGKKIGDILMNDSYTSKGTPQADLGWRRRICYVTFKEDVNAIKITNSRDTSVMFDNIVLQEITGTDENGKNTYGNNLVVNGNFEKYYVDGSKATPTKFHNSDSWAVKYLQSSKWTDETKETSYAKVTSDYARTGNRSLFVHFDGEKVDNKYIQIYDKKLEGSTLPAGNYTFEYWVNGKIGDNDSSSKYVTARAGVYGSSINNANTQIQYQTYNNENDNGWIHKKISVSATEDTKFTYVGFSADISGNFLIDDVKLYNNDTPNVNLLSDGGFENTYSIEETKFTDADGNVLTDIQAGEINIEAKIKNISAGNDFNTAVVVATYKDDILYDLIIANRPVSESSEEIPADKYQTSVTVPNDNAKYEIKVFYWNDFSEISPLTEADILD